MTIGKTHPTLEADIHSRSSAQNSVEKVIFRVGFEILLLSAEFQTQPPIYRPIKYGSHDMNKRNKFSPHDKNRRHRIRSREARLVMPDIPPVSASSHEASPASTPGMTHPHESSMTHLF